MLEWLLKALGPIAEAIARAVRREPVPAPPEPDEVTVNAGDAEARRRAAARAATGGEP